MDVIGAIASVTSIIDVATRCILALAAIRKRYKEANTDIELLEGHIVTVRTVLDQIASLIGESMHDEQHHQLVINLGISMKCCTILLNSMEDQLLGLDTDDDDNLRFQSRVRFALESPTIKDCIQRLSSLITALNCIVTAFHARFPARQKELLEEKSTQRVFDQIRDDSSSLVVLFDSASFTSKRSITTTATSKLSMHFAFDNELLQHRVYKGAFRSLIRRARATTASSRESKQHPTEENQSATGVEDTKKLPKAAIMVKNEVQLTYEPLSHRNDTGPPNSSSSNLAVQATNPYPDFTILVLGEWGRLVKWELEFHDPRSWATFPIKHHYNPEYAREQIMLGVISEFYDAVSRFTLEIIGRRYKPSESELLLLQEHQKTLNSVGGKPDIQDQRLASALRWCAYHPMVAPLIRFPGSYYAQHVERILNLDYIPSENDVCAHVQGFPAYSIYEAGLTIGNYTGQIVTVPSDMREIEKWINSSNFTPIVFTFDLRNLEASVSGGSDAIGLSEALTTYEAMIDSDWITNSLIYLVLLGLRDLETKLLVSNYKSFGNALDPSIVTNDSSEVLDYIESCFYRRVHRTDIERHQIVTLGLLPSSEEIDNIWSILYFRIAGKRGPKMVENV